MWTRQRPWPRLAVWDPSVGFPLHGVKHSVLQRTLFSPIPPMPTTSKWLSVEDKRENVIPLNYHMVFRGKC